MPNDTITALAQDANGQVWLGTRNGLLVYDGATLREVSYAEGLPSKRINSLYQAQQGPFWIATTEGALTYADHRLQPVAALRGLDVEFVGETPTEWVVMTRQGQRRLPKDAPLSWQWWGLAAGVLVGGLGSGLWWRRLRNSRRFEQLQTQLAQAEQRALLAQMNPHFIFNSLSSIQRYILQNEADAAQDYLAKFGQLIRIILEQSRQPLLTLAEEVRMLRSYLELEARRFDNKFTYAVEVASEGLLAEEIPGMLIHPFVENAVWHGLAHHSGPGHVAVRFAQEGMYVVITVQDNGVGRAKAAKMGGTHAGYPSRGTQIVAERIALLNRQASHPIQMEINDLAGELPAEGTRVVIRIPRQHS
ncbi:MAG TPA: histidine kinase [Hymenobacter sp.]